MRYQNYSLRLTTVVLSLGLIACSNPFSRKKSTSNVVTESAEVLVNNAGEVDSFSEGSGTSQVMTPKSKHIYYFQFDSTALSREIQADLKKQAAYLRQHPSTKVLLAGHADIRGTHEYNIGLGQRRAQSVAHYLVSQGVRHKQIETVSFGKEKPVSSLNMEWAHAKNRRVECVYQAPLKI